MKKINIENPFFEFMGSIGDVMLVNSLFLVFSILKWKPAVFYCCILFDGNDHYLMTGSALIW